MNWLFWRKDAKAEKPPVEEPVSGKDRGQSWRDVQRFDRWKLMRDDPQIALGLAAIKAPILGADWFIESDDDEIRDWVTDEIASLWRTMTRKALTAVEFGRSAMEKVFLIGDDKRYHLAALLDIEPDQVALLVDDAGRFAGLRYRGKDLAPDRAWLFVHQEEFGSLHGRSAMKRVEDPWRWAVELYKLTNRYFERMAAPTTLGRAPGEKRRDASGNEYSPMDKLKEAIEDIRSGGYAVLPDEIKDSKYRYDLSYLLDDKRADQMLAYIQHLEALKLRGLLVPERMLTQDSGSTGTYALADVHAEAFLRSEEMLLGDYADAVQDLIDQLVVANWGAGADRAYLRTKPLARDVQALVRQIFQGLAQSSPQAFTAIMDLVALCESVEIPLVDDARERLDKMQALAVAGGGNPMIPTPGATARLRDDFLRFLGENGGADGAGASLKDSGDEPPDAVADIVARYGPKAKEFFEKLRAKVPTGVGTRPFRASAS